MRLMLGSTPDNLEDVARLIQLAIAPIFLLTALATTLTVLAARLARVVDRGRLLESYEPALRARYRDDLLLLERRAHLIYLALSLGVCAAILVCLLMTVAFIGEIFPINAARTVVLLFVGALFSYTGALMCLLREVFLAVANFRLEIHPKGARR